MSFVNGHGRHLGTIANGNPLPDGTPSHMVRRSSLYTALRDEAAARGVRIRYGARVVDARTEPGGGVTAVLADGTQLHADVLIGADGIRSTVRRLIDPDAPRARYVPVLNVGGELPDIAVPGDGPADEFRMMFGLRCFFGIIPTPTGGAVWFANPPRLQEPRPGELEAITPDAWRAELGRLFADDRGPVADAAREVARRAGADTLRPWTTYDLPRVPTWHRGPMALIGDAAHATAPSAGQGAALSLEDAVIIAQCLRDAPDADTAFTAFERLRRERVEKIVANGNRGSSRKAAGPVGRVIRDAMLPMIFRHLSKDDSAATRWITDHHVDWDADVVASAAPSAAPSGARRA
jgi:2-polyprenyl-6-methoxyphenol hydroxylase-like FAD-dependent oxidoreductase